MCIYGQHSVRAALKNSRRKVLQLFITEQNAEQLVLSDEHQRAMVVLTHEEIDRRVRDNIPSDANHQGIAALCHPLTPALPNNIQDQQLTLAVDRITDPHNLGAIMRSCAAFSCNTLVSENHHGARESGSLAKAASGALDVISWARLGSLKSFLIQQRKFGSLVVGLSEHASHSISSEIPRWGSTNITLVMGAEGDGLRPVIREVCDVLVKINTNPDFGTINVSSASAIALYEVSKFLENAKTNK